MLMLDNRDNARDENRDLQRQLRSTKASHKALRVLGYVILILGITTALTGLVAIGRARGTIELVVAAGTRPRMSHERTSAGPRRVRRVRLRPGSTRCLKRRAATDW
jgi:hypothetical protein